MSLASIQPILAVRHHENADSLDIVQVLGYHCIVKRDQWKVGDLCVFIEPDSVLPDAPWSAFYRAKSNRVKSVRLRGSWSMGIVESLSILAKETGSVVGHTAGMDVTDWLGVTKYEAPHPQDLAASGPYGYGIPKTDEERWQSLESIPYGEPCDVTLKIDGQSWSAVYYLTNAPDHVMCPADVSAIGGRSFLYKLDADNNYTRNERQHNVLAKLEAFCQRHNVSLCIRGEQFGHGIQKGNHNPHSKLPLGLAFYSAWLIDEHRYARKGEPFYLFDVAQQMGLPTVPVLERNVILTPELIQRYDEGLERVNGQPFEGVVVQWRGGSFKIINKHYDAKK